MNRGAFDFITKPINFEDLTITMEKTLKHVRQLKETLKAIKENNILKMYVDENVLSFMGRQEYESEIAANENITATVMFIDVCGFTAITERTPADLVVQMLNTYFDAMVKEIIEHEGYVDKFMGDAIMAVYRGEFHLDRAVETAIAIRNKIKELPDFKGIDGYKPMVSIGIKSGEMVSGNIGSSSLRRLDYTVIGDTVNVAARLQGAAGENQIVISEDCYSHVRESFKCKEIGEVTLKNKSNPLTIYEVLE
jgi:class 3 adenylate cyclase